MQRYSEYPLFYQSAIAIFGTLLALSLIGWVMEPKIAPHSSTITSVEVAATQPVAR
jgi:hypothetical protein